MMTTSLAADLLLLAYDDEKGKPRLDSTRLDACVAAAAVVDLTLSGALEVDESERKPVKRRLRVTGRTAPDPVLADIADYVDGKRAGSAISGLAGATSFRNRAGKLRDLLLTQLAEAGVLRRERALVLGVIPRTRWPEADGRHEDELVARVRAVVVDGESPDQRTAALISLLSVTGLLVKVLPGEHKRSVKARGKEIAEGDWAAAGVKAAVDTVNATLVTAAAAANSASS